MAGGAPKTKYTELADRINALANGRARTGKMDEWAWQSLKRDIDKLSAVPEFADSALLLQAVIWGMVANTTEVDRCLSIYAGKYGKDWSWHRARALHGPSLGRLDVVIDMLKFGYPKNDIASVFMVARICNQAGLFVTAASVLHDSEKLWMDNPPSDELRAYVHLPATLAYLDENQIDELEIARRVETASRVVRKMSGPLTTFSVMSNEFGITFEYSVAADIERLVDMDFAISEALVGEFEDTLSRHISIGVVQAEGFDQHVG